MFKNKIQYFLDEYILWNIYLSEIPNFSIQLIEEWYESKSLYILAGLEPTEWQNIKIYFNKVIIECKLNIRSVKDIYLYRFERCINKEEDISFYHNFHNKFNNNELFEIFIILINKYWKFAYPFNFIFWINSIEINTKLPFNNKLLEKINNKDLFIYYLSELNNYSYCTWCTEEECEKIIRELVWE